MLIGMGPLLFFIVKHPKGASMSSGFTFSKRSLDNLSQVHPKLVEVMTLALDLSKVDFVVTEGLRTPSRQELLYNEGASKTLNSRHLAQSDGFSHAVDVAALDRNGEVTWLLSEYNKINAAVQDAAQQIGVKITWGGNWKMVDGPHFQIEGV